MRLTNTRIRFSTAEGKLKKLLKAEGLSVPDTFANNLLVFLSTICTYEEEGRRIRPNVLVGNHIKESIEQIPAHYVLSVSDGTTDGSTLGAAMKSLVPFCVNGWTVYIQPGEEKIEYGLLRIFQGVNGLTLADIAFGGEDDSRPGLLEFRALTRYELSVTGTKIKPHLVDVRFASNASSNHEESIRGLAKCCTVGVQSDAHRTIVEQVMLKVLRLTAERVHGTICVVVDRETVLPLPDVFVDGKCLTTGIDLGTLAIEATEPTASAVVVEKFYGLSGLLIEMMNLDGVCIIDDACQIRAFNVFAQQKSAGGVPILGGARKRAANAIKNSGHPNIRGVYFQSQDGDTWFWERSK